MSISLDMTPVMTNAGLIVTALFGAFAVIIGLKLGFRLLKYIVNEIGNAIS